ncbi:centrosomal protein of 78 kDa [Schistocerca piceifrons]|uniref:centrosomal protein of 78 kDa n=1 Tax=Schistocerca piceifrons TaxID=274613 RepID=UPI001F5E8397|nr:centrosomal protein of 78 kDa [Schistocerca piceifrons]
MIGSVATRKKNSPKFHAYYEDLCELHNVMPLRMITSQKQKDILDICADRIKFDELFPITKALACDRSLCFIAVRSRCQGKYVHHNFYGKRRSNVRHRPLIHTDFGMNVVINALKKCLMRTTVLTHLILEGLYFTKNNLSLLCTGLSNCSSVQNISFHQSIIGDDGCQLICDAVKKLRNVHSLNISACDIGQSGGYCISQLLKYQQLERYSETWKEALRYRIVDVDRMPGIRRVSINNNTRLGDAGLMYLVECLKDDLWLKAIDLQNCGITNQGAQEILKLLKVNTILTVVDVRNNHDVNGDLLNAIKKQLAENSSRNVEDTQEYKWMTLDASLEEQSHSAASKTHPYFMYSNQERSLHQKGVANGRAAGSTSFWAQESCGSSYLPHQLNVELKQHMNRETKIQELTEELNKMHLEIKKVKEERDRYKKELQEMKADYNNHILLNVDTVHAINEAFDKLTTYLKRGRNGENENT